MRRVTDICRMRGVTLVEMIVSIVVMGILMGIISMFVRNQVQIYTDVAARTELADAADTALRRMARDLHGALPNSTRVSGAFLEFVPIRDAGRYRAQFGGGAGEDILDFTSILDGSFNVFGPPVTVVPGDQLVIYNLGVPGADVYTGTTRRMLTAAGSLSTLSYTVGGVQFPQSSPQNRFHIVGGPVSYECAPDAGTPELGTIIRHACYAYADPQPTAFATPYAASGCTGVVQDSVLVAGVTACGFTYTPGALQRNGIVSLSVTLSRNNETITLFQQVDVANTP